MSACLAIIPVGNNMAMCLEVSNKVIIEMLILDLFYLIFFLALWYDIFELKHYFFPHK